MQKSFGRIAHVGQLAVAGILLSGGYVTGQGTNDTLITASMIQPRGQRYEAVVPDTLDLAERAKLSVHGLTSFLNPLDNYAPPIEAYYNMKPAAMAFTLGGMMNGSYNWGKIAQSLLLARVMCGSEENLDIEAQSLQGMLAFPPGSSPSPSQTMEYPCMSRIMLALTTLQQISPTPALRGKIQDYVQTHIGRATVGNDMAWYYDGPRDNQTWGGKLGWWQQMFMHGTALRALSSWNMLDGDANSLMLASQMKNFLFQAKFYAPEAEPMAVISSDRAHFDGHFHSNAAALMGLSWYAGVAHDPRAMQFARSGYEYLRNWGIARIGLFGESCGVGDMTMLAIKLTELGAGDYWEDVDSYVRNHLTELQITDSNTMQAVVDQMPPAQGLDPRYTTIDLVVERTVGTYFSDSSHPSLITQRSFRYTICCSGNCTPALYYAWEGITRYDGATKSAVINLLLNRASAWLDIDSYLPYEGKVVIRNKTASNISVRIPSWADKTAVRALVNGQPAQLRWNGQYLRLDDLASSAQITITFPMVRTVEQYTITWTESDPGGGGQGWFEGMDAGSGHGTYTCTFKGNTLVDIAPRSSSLGYPLYRRDRERDSDQAPTNKVTRFVSSVLPKEWKVGNDTILTSVTSVSVPEGGTNTFQVNLSSQPTSSVVVAVAWTGDDTGDDSDITVTGGTNLTFTTNNWDTYQIVTLAAAEDADAADGSATIACSGTGLVSATVIAAEEDNDTTLTVTAGTGGSTTPGGATVVPQGAAAGISATANAGYIFANWSVTSGAATFANSNAASTTVTLSAPATVQANFEVIPPAACAITSPANGSVWKAGTNLTVSATASSYTGTVSKVEFFHDGVKIGEGASEPYSCVWSNVPLGSYALTARAYDSSGATGLSASVAIVVTASGSWDGVNATGGTVTNYTDAGGTNWTAHIFTNTASSTSIVFQAGGVIEYLVVGGGGGGGSRYGGGGGAGGFLIGATNIGAFPITISITVGAGGAGSTTPGNGQAPGANGSSSIFATITAAGGGGGGGHREKPSGPGTVNGVDGGSGGGSGCGNGGLAMSPTSGGTATPSGQGNNGGLGTDNVSYYLGGGGGGAGSVGSNATSSVVGAGGSGSVSSMTGSSVMYAAGGSGGSYYAGTVGTTGANNTGNGGGGAGGESNYGGAGGSGIVIVRYFASGVVNPDANGNGLPDAWETQYFGGATDPTADPDHDNFSNLKEYLAGTNPTNAASVLAFSNIRADFSGTVLHWQSVTGRTYSVHVSTNLIMDRFTNNVIGGLPADPPENVYTDTVDRLGGVFYRIWVDQ